MRRVRTRLRGQTAYFSGFFAVLALLAASAALARTWKSKDGNYRVEADLVKSENGKVTLRKPDGQTFAVDESKLCDDDRAYLKSGGGEAAEKTADPAEPKKPRTFADLTQRANTCDTAVEVVALYKEFLADTSIGADELLSARNNLPIWESRAAKKMVRLGSRWMEPEQAAKLKEKTATLIQETIVLIESKQPDKARKKLSDASREDPESLEANFLSGLISVFGHRELNVAKREFSECVRRQPNHVPALNNLALVEVRLNKYTDAIAHWKTAVETATASREISQNVGRLVELSRNRVCSVPVQTQKKLDELYNSLSSPVRSKYSSRIGWLYMPFDTHKGADKWIVPDKDMPGGGDPRHHLAIGEDALCMRCGGLGGVKCPNKQCMGGSVPAGQKVEAVNTMPGSGITAHATTPKYANCLVCGGRGKVRCPDCINGIDKNIVGRTR